jgi:hypothetical protein
MCVKMRSGTSKHDLHTTLHLQVHTMLHLSERTLSESFLVESGALQNRQGGAGSPTHRVRSRLRYSRIGVDKTGALKLVCGLVGSQTIAQFWSFSIINQ